MKHKKNKNKIITFGRLRRVSTSKKHRQDDHQ